MKEIRSFLMIPVERKQKEKLKSMLKEKGWCMTYYIKELVKEDIGISL